MMLWEGYRQADMEVLFADETLFRLWWRVELVLAQTLADFGRIPRSAAEELAAFSFTPEHTHAVLEASRQWRATGNVVMAFIALMREWVGESGEYLHWGATSQDITDTALALQLQEGVELFQTQVDRLLAVMAAMAEHDKTVPTVARTNGQQAEPMTVGFKWAVAIPEFHRHRERLEEMTHRIVSGQMTGSVGTYAAWEPDGWRVGAEVNRRLGLTAPVATWHSIRDTVVEYVTWILGVTASVERVAMDVYLLQMSEVGELLEAHEDHSIGSSSMPHKINPFSSNMIRSMAQIARTHGSGIWEAVQVMHEREAGRNRREYIAVAEASIWGYSALSALTELLAGVRVQTGRLRENMQVVQDRVVSQGVMMIVAERIGRQAAHHRVREWIQASPPQNFLPYALQKMEAMGLDGVANDPRLSVDFYVALAEQRTNAILRWAKTQPWWQLTMEYRLRRNPQDP